MRTPVEAFYQALKHLKTGTESESNGRHLIPIEAVRACGSSTHPRILDVAAGRGADLTKIGLDLEQAGREPELFAVESFPESIEVLRRAGVMVSSIDIEHEVLPFDNDFFDVVICNQVLEHTKEIFWIISEIARVMKPKGVLILGVPNLGSLHNRIALLVGHQPPAIAVFGPHVRGLTVPGLTNFLETGNILKVKKVLGGNFYPFPPKISRSLARLFPSLSVSSFYIVQRVGDANFLSIFKTALASELVDTPYFRGSVRSLKANEGRAAVIGEAQTTDICRLSNGR
jgi:SAM-dependent methyltransferase